MKLSSTLRTSRLCSLVLAAAGVTDGVVAEEGIAPTTPADWLHAMDDAFRNLNYDGVFEYSIASHSQIRIQNRQGNSAFRLTAEVAHDVTVASFRIVHMVIDGVEHERIAHRGGPGREILRTGGQVSYVLPADGKSFAVAAGLPTGPYPGRIMRSEDLSANYRFNLSGRSSVIERPAVCLEVHPLDDDRYGFLLWLDEETGLLLRSELRDANGRYLERVEFLSLTVGDSVSEDALQSEIPGVRVQPADESSAAPAPPTVPVSWKIGWVPAGFRITDAHPREARKGVHVMFSDGLATFSVFIEAAPQSAAGGVFSRNGATVLLSHDLTGERGDYLVTVVGEVPPETAHRVAESVFRGQ
ncbi:MAG: MucB/RseB C-terminal domain-containing protein [Gammaproteobacteria bacterium]|nr:MucB/RseB C-terminal domain-containing protein [Gammaproteobacteria bacterium]